MQISSGIAYFGNSSQGNVVDKINHAMECDIDNIQLLNTEIKKTNIESIRSLDYQGNISCYLDDMSWINGYVEESKEQFDKLKEIGVSSLVIPTMIEKDEYKKMSQEEKVKLLSNRASLVRNMAMLGFDISLMNDNDSNSLYLGEAVLVLCDSLDPSMSNKIGLGVEVSNRQDGNLAKLDFNKVKTVNYLPVTNDRYIDYPETRREIGNSVSEMVRFGHVPSVYAVCDKSMDLGMVTSTNSLLKDIIDEVEYRNGDTSSYIKTKGRRMSGYHEMGVSSDVPSRNELGFVNLMQLFMIIAVYCLIGSMIAVILVLL